MAYWTRLLRLERCGAIGLGLVALGLLGTILALNAWGHAGFGSQDARAAIRVVLPSATAIATGILVVFSGLFGSLLTLRIANPQIPTATGGEPAPDNEADGVDPDRIGTTAR